MLGFWILATLLVLPLSGALVNHWYDVFRVQDYFVPLSKLLIAMVVGCIGAALFLRQSQLRKRLAPQPKGAMLMLAGAVAFVACPAMLAGVMHAGYRSDVLSFLPMHGLTHYPAFLILAAGAVRVFLHLKPAA